MILHLRQQSLLVRSIWALLILSAVAAAFEGRWSLTFVALATLALSLAPLFLASRLNITLPLPFVAAMTIFVVASIFMGEAFDFYERVWWWDIALHGSSAIGFGLLGFVFVLMMFEGDRFAAPPWAMCLMAFGLAVTVGTCWEIFEFAMDQIFGLNMQKSGLIDTMWDLIVDVCGAFIAAISGWNFMRGKKALGIFTPVISKFVLSNLGRFKKFRERHKK